MPKPEQVNNQKQGYRWLFKYAYRDRNGKERWATKRIDRPTDKQGRYLTARAEQKEIELLYAVWVKEQKEIYKKDPETKLKGKTPFDSFVKEHWQKDYVEEQRKPYTRSTYNSTIKPALDFFGNKAIALIDEEEIIRFINYLKKGKQPNGKPYSQNTINTQYATFTSVMSYAKQIRYIKENPCENTDGRDIPKTRRPKPEPLTREQLQEILEKLKTEPLYWRSLIEMLATTGLRRGEAIALRWQDIPNEPTVTGKYPIRIFRNATHTAASGTVIGTTKTDKERTVYINERMYTELQELKAERKKAFNFKDDTFVWCSSKDLYTPILPQVAGDWYRHFIKKHNLPKCHLHTLRHTFATLTIAENKNIKDVQTLLGHSSPNTTLLYYIGAVQANLENAADIVGNMI